jgi:hypothetical protein
VSKQQSKSFLIGRNAINGRLMSVEAARRNPAQTVVERMPKPGRGDAPKKK